ncbi:MAG: tetratricopeptide repeat protein [Polyangiaceae bacterium]|nr:tetratricopeptide repeat protein [Polyangiaceae bacterium]
MFKDLELAVELARLQLLRDAERSTIDTDRAEALRNAQRATATDANRPLSRLIVTLAQGRAMLKPMTQAGPALRALLLGLFQQLTEGAIIQAKGAEAAAMHTLVGFIQLDRGDVAAAHAAFLTALDQHPRFAPAELGAGDAARAQGDFKEARRAYERCLALDPQSPDAALGLEAVKRRTALLVQPPPELPPGTPILDSEPLASTQATPNLCSPTARKSTPALCKALDELHKVDTPDATAQSGKAVLDEVWGQDCIEQRTQCDDHIALAVLEVSKAFARGNSFAKSIVVAKVAMANPGLGKANQEAILLAADAYYRIGIASIAANFYARYSGTKDLRAKAHLRGFMLKLVTLSPSEIHGEAQRLARERDIPKETRDALIQLAELAKPRRSTQEPKAEAGPPEVLSVASGLWAILETPSWSPASGR